MYVVQFLTLVLAVDSPIGNFSREAGQFVLNIVDRTWVVLKLFLILVFDQVLHILNSNGQQQFSQLGSSTSQAHVHLGMMSRCHMQAGVPALAGHGPLADFCPDFYSSGICFNL